MFRRSATAAAIAVMMCLAAGAGAGAADDHGCANAGAAPDAATVARAADAVLCLINGERTARGLSLLRPSRALTRAAQAHSLDMVARRFFAHRAPGGAGVRARVRRAGYARRSRSWSVGETIAGGSGPLATPAELVASLLSSSGHRGVLLDATFRDVGVGLALGAPVGDGDGATLTVDVGRRR